MVRQILKSAVNVVLKTHQKNQKNILRYPITSHNESRHRRLVRYQGRYHHPDSHQYNSLHRRPGNSLHLWEYRSPCRRNDAEEQRGNLLMDLY